MAWTEERIETLKKLWADGFSASQIAKQLGGVTRSAVIGKVHRLGLSGRAAPSRPARLPKAKPPPKRGDAPAVASNPQPVQMQQKALPAPVPEEAKRLPSGEYATVLTIKDSMCKWPIGDPADKTFRLCGRRSSAGESYCGAHQAIAYQPQGKTRGRKAAIASMLEDMRRRKPNFA